MKLVSTPPASKERVMWRMRERRVTRRLAMRLLPLPLLLVDRQGSHLRDRRLVRKWDKTSLMERRGRVHQI
jgi:hypothetical protein